MKIVKGTHITSVNSVDPYVRRAESTGSNSVFGDSQFIHAKDGSWLMVDWIEWASGQWSWYVIECSI